MKQTIISRNNTIAMIKILQSINVKSLTQFINNKRFASKSLPPYQDTFEELEEYDSYGVSFKDLKRINGL